MDPAVKKILFMDLDATFLNDKKEITAENKKAVHEALKHGHQIVLCTGRPLCGITKVTDELDFYHEGCYAITYNGGLIYDCGRRETLFIRTLPMEDVQHIFREADNWHLHAQTYDSKNLLCRSMDEVTEYYIKRTAAPLKLLPSLPDGLTEEPVKVLVADLNHHDYVEQFREALEPWAKGRVSLCFSNPFYLECVKEGISKGSAIRFLCDRLHIPLENTIGAGDSENDIPMLAVCGTGCAMANATDVCKKAAAYVTERDCENSGVAEIIEKYML